MKAVLGVIVGCASMLALFSAAVIPSLLAQDKPNADLPERQLVRDAHDAYELDVKRAMLEYEKSIKKAKEKLSAVYDRAVNSANRKGVEGNILADELTAEKAVFDIATADEGSVADGEVAVSPKRREVIAKLTKSRWRSTWERTNPEFHDLTFKADGSHFSDRFGKGQWKIERRWVMDIGGSLIIQMSDEHWRGFYQAEFREVNLHLAK